jgi:hypothetical protein
MKTRRFLLLSVLFAGMASSAVSGRHLDPMIARTDICLSKDVRIQRLGKIARSGHTFTIFDYRWRWNNGNRLTQRLLIFRDGRYFGNYYTTGISCSVQGDGLRCSGSRESGNVIGFSERGPPAKVHLDGEIKSFDRDKSYMRCPL